MLYTMLQLMRKFDRSKSFIKNCIDRFSIKKTRLKTTRQLVYDIPREKLELIKEYDKNSRVRKKKMNVKFELEKLIKEADWKLESLPEEYFIEYFEKEFINKMKTLVKELK